MQFLPYSQTVTVPNIVVDGAGNDQTVLTLSHWPKSGSPVELKADTSTEMVFNYLDFPRFRVQAEVVSNNHFDEDGLAGIFAIVQPDAARRHRDLLVDVARAGDFGVFRQRRAARIVFVLCAYLDPGRSPLPADLLTLPYAEQTGRLYLQLLDLLPALLENVDDYRALWEDEDARLTASEELIEAGLITIEELPDLDLAIIRLPEDLSNRNVQRTTRLRLTECHPFALHNRTSCTRLLLLRGQSVVFQYRYESWVQLVSRRPAPRVDLSGLADELNREETSGGHWVFDGIDQITPELHLEGSAATSMPVDTVVSRIQHHLGIGPAAWAPYD